jgi:elongator complex protein 2
VGGIGGNTLGFYGCAWGPDGRYILANAYNGAFHLWEVEKQGDTGDEVQPL